MFPLERKKASGHKPINLSRAQIPGKGTFYWNCI